jgi:transposase
MGLEGYQHLRTDFREGKIIFHIEKKPGKRTCACCGASAQHLKLDGRFERTFLGLPVGFKLQEVVLHGHLQLCSKCEARVREPIPFADGKSRCLRALGRYIVGMCELTTMKNVAALLKVGWDMVKDLFKADLERRHKRRKLGKVRYLAVDEFATHKGHKYMTTAMDLETGEILFANEGNDADALIPFLKRLKRAKVPLKAVAMDKPTPRPFRTSTATRWTSSTTPSMWLPLPARRSTKPARTCSGTSRAMNAKSSREPSSFYSRGWRT